MALSHLLKYIYTNGTDEVIRRGKKIHAIGFVELIEHDDLFSSATFRVKDDNYAMFYKVYIQQYKDAKTLSLRCACPYNLGDICRHEVAALLKLQELMDQGTLQAENAAYDQRHTVAKMKAIDAKTLRLLCSPQVYAEAEKYLQSEEPVIEKTADETVKAKVTLHGKTYSVIIRRNEERTFDTNSDFTDTEHLLCLPKVIVFLYLLYKHGPHYFDTIRNWDKEKNKLLEAYGYSLNDDWKGKFEFSYKEGKPFLRVLDTSIKRVSAPAPLPKKAEEEPQVAVAERDMATNEAIRKRIGIVFNFNKKGYPYFSIDAVEGEWDEYNNLTGTAQKLDLTKYINLESYSEADKTLLSTIRKLQEAEINKYINRNSPFSGFWENIVHHEEDDLPAETKALITEYLLPKLKKLFAENGQSPVYVLPAGKLFKTAHLQKVELGNAEMVPQFEVNRQEGQYCLECLVKPDSVVYSLAENEIKTTLVFLYNHQLFLWQNAEAAELAGQYLPEGKKVFSEDAWPDAMVNVVLPLSKTYKVEFNRSLISEVKEGEPEVKLYLQEKGEYLVFQPIFNYKGYDARVKDNDELIVPQGQQVIIVRRNREAETAFLKKLQTLHSNFVPMDNGATLALKGADVLKNNWFFLFVDAMKEQKVPVYGFESLKNFRFNTAKPQTHIYISSHTDWFDAKVDIVFGDQKVSVAEVKKALANKQQFVQLNDGTLGILPEDWLKKYALLFRVGEGRGDKLKLSRYHLSVIDDLYENRNEEELTLQLEEKYEKIRDFQQIKEIDPPADLQKVLRPYQVAGYQWLNYLHEVSWGGILADDMGLGKTVQALSFLQHYHDTHDSLKALVVCPTTLIYNWENEIKKFTPSLTYHIHHGSARLRDVDELQRHEIIITTYGTLRSDIKLFLQIPLDYVVLDESQAIKNPASKVTKAASLLRVKHRLCMSGTPLQNNTFDVYAQMNFLNPGMLGTVEFFRQEFAIPIDKFGEQEQKEHLRKILYPFILRRTKEQVAKDLPDKTETVLFCEMGNEQRKIYDAYRNDYRSRIMGTIEEQGIQKSQLTILQGLMKLRQICDSPAILNEAEKFENHSIKLEELAREITENIGNHKTLIFSQFLGMLSLIRQKLEELGIKYEYFDGSTSAPDRETAIQSFQGDDEVRVFLISLKAGGVGLNLTAADYVYIVDPWWNPAVEQQAIDRTHRIGQTKNIFAYRMICKDTIEDKIMQLQDRKRLLAKELITDDTTFVKSLTREDVEYLFS
ncbi:MAG: SNF2 helicase associated domain-containing protein [Flavisolibacter sp.]|nr:SNF2 helicase associated domain-containing protein [Flavisolibacter sp.]MBD0350046.1 SNF2 helicase associated domain-containing protein [Flavisolibacter sp.]